MTDQTHQHFTARGDLTKKSILMRSFIGGIAWGVGSVVGATVVVTIVVYILKLLGIFSALSENLTNLR